MSITTLHTVHHVESTSDFFSISGHRHSNTWVFVGYLSFTGRIDLLLIIYVRYDYNRRDLMQVKLDHNMIQSLTYI